MYEKTRFETVGSDGILRIAVPDLTPGQVVEVTLRDAPQRKYRHAGRLEARIHTADDFNAPLPVMIEP